MARHEMRYDVVTIVEMGPGKMPDVGQRVASGIDAKTAAKVAVTAARSLVPDGGRGYRVLRSVVVPEGFSPNDVPVMRCTTGDFRQNPRAEAASARRHRLALERRGGITRTVMCDVVSPAFKKAISKKKRRRSRR